MPARGYALGIDFGTSNTVAVLCPPGGRCRPLLVDGSPLLPSAVYADPAGVLVAGRDALHDARLDPARCEPSPKRRMDERSLTLGETVVSTVDVVAAVLARVAEEALRTAGDPPSGVTLTCPATWGPARRLALSDAAARAGLSPVRLVPEPVAAATYFITVLGRPVPVGSAIVVYDLGAGTFDASVVVRTATGFDVRAVDGRDDLGGLDLDAAIVGHLGVRYGQADPPGWARLRDPRTVEDRRARTQLWDDVRVAKERLSRAREVELRLPILDVTAHLARDELETLARPLLERTVRITQGAVRWAGVRRVTGVFLVGGASRVPLVARMLHDALGEPPTVVGAPELVVAEGSVSAPAELDDIAPAVDFAAAAEAGSDEPGLAELDTAEPGSAEPGSAEPGAVEPDVAGPGSATPAGTPLAARPGAEPTTADLGVGGPHTDPGWPAGPAGWAAPPARAPRAEPARGGELPLPPRPPVPAARATDPYPVRQPPRAPAPVAGQPLYQDGDEHPIRRMLVVVFLAVVLTALPLVAGYVTFKLTLHQPLLPISFEPSR